MKPSEYLQDRFGKAATTDEYPASRFLQDRCLEAKIFALLEAVEGSDLKANGPNAHEPGKAWCSRKSLLAILSAALALKGKP